MQYNVKEVFWEGQAIYKLPSNKSKFQFDKVPQ